MIDPTVRDVLLYLPDWTTEPPNKPEHRKYAQAFIDKDEEEDFINRRHVTEDEVLSTYHRTRRQVAFYLNRKTLPDVPVIYDYVCMWTAGVLEEKYHFKEYDSTLIKDAKEALKPFIKKRVTSLNPHKPDRIPCSKYYEYFICDPPDHYKHRRKVNQLQVKTVTSPYKLKVQTITKE